ncbi:hypothetical protein KUCAC02_026032 [Chaenocephalus aceratus]|uniref:Uncharacterized protein n=1 Tax=Chaenocephalus aceratus TaxID=36190 RepID=A0ACB9VX20_CHAAC|nr:hypothetical protein KUCAC02_026032 [Chaenocephalus aceratus]
MASSYGSLAKEAIVLLDRFRAGRQCLDDFMEEASKDLQNMDTVHQKFILDVVSGCIEQTKLLDVVVNVFYGQNGRCLSRGDRSQLVIICYLAFSFLDDLGLQHFSNIIKSLDIKKMHTFLTFFFTNLTTWIQDEWNNIYEAAYVEKLWVGPLLRWRPEMDILLDQLAVKISHGTQVKKAHIKTTEPQEFSLTKPKPRPLPVPEVIPLQEKSKPVPDSTYKAPKEMQMIEEIKQKNLQKTEELLYEANMKQFRCVNPQKSEHTKRAMSQIKEGLDSKLKFNSFHSSENPSSNKTNSWPIKLNSAAILRQGALYDRQVEEELQRKSWPKIERRHLEGRISYGRGSYGPHTHNVTQPEVCSAKERRESSADAVICGEKGCRRKRNKRLSATSGRRTQDSKAAKERIQKCKQSIVKEVSEQRQELYVKHWRKHKQRILTTQRLQDMSCWGDVPGGAEGASGPAGGGAADRAAGETGAHPGGEANKKQLLLEQLDTIELHRRALAQAAAIRKEERKSRPFHRQAMTHDETILALQKKLEEKQQERQRLKQTQSKKAKPSEPTAAHTESLTETSWEELELSFERHIQKDAPSVVSQKRSRHKYA